MIIRASSILCACTFFFSMFVPHILASDFNTPSVTEIDIEIGRTDYLKLTNEPDEDPYPVTIRLDGAKSYAAEINLRGSSSKHIGQATKTKRIPFELSVPGEAGAALGFMNDSVKFINSFTLYRLIAEYLALEMFESFGIPTPAHKLCFVRFNGVDFGLYLAVEDVNKAFLSKHFPQPLQTAYKATNKDGKEGAIDSKWFGCVFPKAKKDPQPLLTLLDKLNSGTGYEDMINTDEWMRYFACVAATGGDASIFSERNNFVLYWDGEVFALIPWDQSEAFSGRETPNGIDRYYIGDDPADPNPLFDLMMSDASNKERYHAYIRELCETYLYGSSMDQRYTAVIDAISEYLPRDHSIALNSKKAERELRSYESDGFLNLRYVLNGSCQNLLDQLDGKEDTFFVNDSYREIYEFESYEDLANLFKKLTPFYDTKLPKKIADASAESIAARQNPGYILIPAGAAIAATTVFSVLIIISKKRRKQERREEKS